MLSIFFKLKLSSRKSFLTMLFLSVFFQAEAQSSAEKLFTSAIFTPKNSFTTGVEGPAVDQNGNIYAVNFNREGTIGKMTPDGKAEVFVELPAGSVGNGIRFDSRRNMLIAEKPCMLLCRIREIYTVWAFLPLILQTYLRLHPASHFNVSLFCFLIIASGFVADIIGGYLSQSIGSKKVASGALFFSGICCLLSPLFFQFGPILFLALLFFWNMNIAADSPQFSTLTASNAPPELKGSAMTLVNCIGFFITIISIQITNSLLLKFNPVYVFPMLALGPVFGLIALRRK